MEEIGWRLSVKKKVVTWAQGVREQNGGDALWKVKSDLGCFGWWGKCGSQISLGWWRQ